jgi:hypothetical protein
MCEISFNKVNTKYFPQMTQENSYCRGWGVLLSVIMFSYLEINNYYSQMRLKENVIHCRYI